MAYEKDQTENSYTFKYLDTAKQIQFRFVSWLAISVSNKQALIKRLSKSQLNLCRTALGSVRNPMNLGLTNIRPFEMNTASYDLIPITNISLCVCVCIDDVIFICHQSNTLESNL